MRALLVLILAVPAAAAPARIPAVRTGEGGAARAVRAFFAPDDASPSLEALLPHVRGLAGLPAGGLANLGEIERAEAREVLGIVREQAARARQARPGETPAARAERLRGLALLATTVKAFDLTPKARLDALEALFEARARAGFPVEAPSRAASPVPLDAADRARLESALGDLAVLRLRGGTPAQGALRRRADGLIAAGRVLLGRAPGAGRRRIDALPPIRGVEDWHREAALLRAYDAEELADVLSAQRSAHGTIDEPAAFEALETSLVEDLRRAEETGARVELYNRAGRVMYPFSVWPEALARGRVPVGFSWRPGTRKTSHHDLRSHYFALAADLFASSALRLAEDLFVGPVPEAADRAYEIALWVSAARPSEAVAGAQRLFGLLRAVAPATREAFPSRRAYVSALRRFYGPEEELDLGLKAPALRWRDEMEAVLRAEPSMPRERFLSEAAASYRRLSGAVDPVRERVLAGALWRLLTTPAR